MHILVSAMKKIDAFFEFISKVCAIISGVIIIGVMLIIFAGVFNRAFSLGTWLFVEEYSALALIPMSYLVMGYTLRWNQHLKMDLIVRNVPKRWKQVLGIFASIFSLVCIGYMVKSSVNWLAYSILRHTVSSGAMQTPLWIINSFILAGLVLFAIDMMLLTISRIGTLIYGKAWLRFLEDDETNSSLSVGGAECN